MSFHTYEMLLLSFCNSMLGSVSPSPASRPPSPRRCRWSSDIGPTNQCLVPPSGQKRPSDYWFLHTWGKMDKTLSIVYSLESTKVIISSRKKYSGFTTQKSLDLSDLICFCFQSCRLTVYEVCMDDIRVRIE